jgi:BlaI family transcriptional regulator, penicillinase repressor
MSADLESLMLTRRELQIMKVVWDKKSATVKEVHSVLNKMKSISPNTILTMVRILEHKGALTHRRYGRFHVYEPLLSRRQANQNQIRDMIARFFDGNPGKLIEDVVQNYIKAPEQLGIVKALVESRLAPAMAMEVRAPQSHSAVAAP